MIFPLTITEIELVPPLIEMSSVEKSKLLSVVPEEIVVVACNFQVVAPRTSNTPNKVAPK